MDSNVSRDQLRQAEEDLRLVDQVRSKVKQDAAPWSGFFAPGGLPYISEAIKMRFVLDQTSQQLAIQYLFHGQKVTIPPPILKRTQDTVLFTRQADQFLRLARSIGERLFYNYVFVSQ